MSNLNDSNLESQKINRIITSRFEHDTDTLDALKELSTFYTENTPYMRRNLRTEIEKRNIAINEEFLFSLRKIKDSFDVIYNDIATMSTSVNDMTNRLQKIKLQNRSLIEQTNGLQKNSQVLHLQEEVANAFIMKFQLTPAEKVALHGATRNESINSDIFKALDRIHEINTSCRSLIQSGCKTLAVDILEQMNLHQEGALERLYRWTQSNCRNIDSPNITSLVTEAMARLQDRPVLFKNIIDEYCTARRSVLVKNFIDALTIGKLDKNGLGMDMHAHDPQRYVGDMLAWLNQAIPAEKENLLVLVRNCDKLDVSDHISTALANISEGVCHPLKGRVEKILTLPAESTTLYSVTNLIRFYRNAIVQIVKGGMLESTLNSLHDVSERAFLGALQSQVFTALTRVEAPPEDLSPTPAISHMLVVLREVLSTASMVEDCEEDMKKIVACVLDPLLHAVNEQASRLPSIDMAVYLLNCMHAMCKTLSSYNYMDERMERLQGMCDAQLDTLTSEQASSLVANLNLGPIYTILQGQEKGPLSNIPGMEALNLKNFVNKLDLLIEHPDTLLLPQICFLLSIDHRNSVLKRAFDVLLGIYKQLYEEVYNPANLYENPAAILSRTSDELSKLLNY